MISFAIVNWKGGSVFGSASIAAEVEANRDLSCELLAVDNGSTHEEIQFLYKYWFRPSDSNDRNVGYATLGTNQSLGGRSGEYVFLLNNDGISYRVSCEDCGGSSP